MYKEETLKRFLEREEVWGDARASILSRAENLVDKRGFIASGAIGMIFDGYPDLERKFVRGSVGQLPGELLV